MTRRESQLPGPDVPSAEVLDELLRAFSADVTDEARLRRVDLTSPEVDELISGTPVPSPAVEPDGEVDDADETSEQSAGGGDEPPAPADGDAGPDEPTDAADVDVAPRVGADAPSAVETVDTAEEADAEEVAADETAEHDAGASPRDSSQGRRIIVITDHQHDAVDVAGGDPLLAAAAAAATDALPTAVVEDGRVFIDDTDASRQSDVISLEEAVTATRIEPRRKERRKAVKKAAGRKRLKWFLIVVGVLALVVGSLAVLGSGLFAIEDIEVEGAERTDEESLAAVVEDLRGTPVLRADTTAAEEALELIPWVEAARVTTDFPHGARIELRERTPMATFVGADGAFRLIDTDGRVLEVLEEQPTDHLLVTSEAAPDLAAGTFAPKGFRAAASLIQALTPQMRGLAQSVQVTADGGDLRLLLTEGVEVHFGASEELVAKLVRLQTWLDVGRDGAVRTVDVSTDEVTTSR